mmetsp:Transcript_15515/g.28219  ORF Transcript_15515/g.28219 Transcript_15515/m.28219 type:complete len:260 (+) Transcript_15515:184-963(+)
MFETLHEPLIQLFVSCVGCHLVLCYSLNLPAHLKPLSNRLVAILRQLCHLEWSMLAEFKAQWVLRELYDPLLLCGSQELDFQGVCWQWLQGLYEQLVHVLEVVVLEHIVVLDAHNCPAFLDTHLLCQTVALEEVIHLDRGFPSEYNANRMMFEVERVDILLLILEVDACLRLLRLRRCSGDCCCCSCCRYHWRCSCCRCWWWRRWLRRRWRRACRYGILSRRRCSSRNQRFPLFLLLLSVCRLLLILSIKVEAAQEAAQ